MAPAGFYGRTLPTVTTLLAAGLAVSAMPASAQNAGGTDATAAQKAATTSKDTKSKAAPAKAGQKTSAQTKGGKAAGTGAANAQPGRAVPQGTAGAAQGAPAGPGGPPITIFPGGNRGAGGQGGGFGGGAAAGTRFSFDFHGSDIGNVLRFYSQMSNETIVADPSLSGPVTIINPKQVTLDEAFTILQSVLAVRGFNAIQQGDTISVQSIASATKNTGVLNPGLAESGFTRVDPRNQVMTQVIPLENVDAGTLAKELTPLINTGASLIASTGTNVLILTDTASNVQRFIDLTASLDKASNQSVLKTYPLRNAEASAIADIINNLYKASSPRGQGATGGAPQPGQPGFNPGAPQQPGAAASGPAAVVAVGDSRTNSVIVVASPGTQERIATDIINRLDDDQTNSMDVTIRKVIYADATQVANTVNTVLSNLHGSSGSSGGGAPSFQQRAFGGGGFGGFFGGGGNNNSQSQTVTSTDPFAKVAADTRTNSVIITAAPDRIKKINELIDQLDANVPVEPTTFVFNLKNANADDVAYALSTSFGTSASQQNPFGNFGGGGGASNSGLNGNQHTPIQRRLTATQGQAGRAASPNRPYSNVPPSPPNAPGDPQATQGGDDGTNVSGGSAVPQGVAGVMTANGFVPMDTSAGANGQLPTRQFFFGGGRGFGQQQNTGPTSGRGTNGNFTNLLQLRDNVYVTSAPGGDSVIVTTTPDNYEAVRQIIEALDTVPRQVVIEVIVAEVTLTKDNELGFTANGLFSRLFSKTNTGTDYLNLPAPSFISGSPNTTTASATAVGQQFVISATNYGGLVQALESDTKVKVLATPRVFTSNSQEAEVDITTKIPYIQGTTTATTGASTSQITTADIGYILNVTPRITRQGQVTLDVRSQADNLQSYTTLGSGANASTYPVVNDRYVDTEVTAQDGQTIVLGGLINTTDTLNITKVPVLSDIPVLGQFFRGRQKTTTKTELVIFLTPHVINSAQEATDMAIKQGQSVTKQIPELGQQQPNLAPPQPLNRLPANQQPGTPRSTRGVKPPAKTGNGTTTPNTNGTTPNPNGPTPNAPGLNPNANGGSGTP